MTFNTLLTIAQIVTMLAALYWCYRIGVSTERKRTDQLIPQAWRAGYKQGARTVAHAVNEGSGGTQIELEFGDETPRIPASPEVQAEQERRAEK